MLITPPPLRTEQLMQYLNEGGNASKVFANAIKMPNTNINRNRFLFPIKCVESILNYFLFFNYFQLLIA